MADTNPTAAAGAVLILSNAGLSPETAGMLARRIVGAARREALAEEDADRTRLLDDLHRQIEHHRVGKARWRARAEKAEARVAELEAALAIDPDPISYGPRGYRCGCGKDAHSNLVPCTPDPKDVAEAEGAQRSVDAQFPIVAAFLNEAGEPRG
ncbi:coiled-coil domain-containing protein [Streptomyces vinaceus]|uniref:hypothetical protein n=1 Tax=Streptomyces vinaceus TaxID=1960 RepID=UPI00368FAA5F